MTFIKTRDALFSIVMSTQTDQIVPPERTLRRKFNFPGFTISVDESIAQVVPEKEENRRQFAKAATMIELLHISSRRGDLEGARIMQRMIEAHEHTVLKEIKAFKKDYSNELKGISKTIEKLPQLAVIESKVRDLLKELKEAGIVDINTIAKEVSKEFNSKYGLNELCETLRKAYRGDGQVTKAIQNIEKILDKTEDLEKIAEELPDDEKIAKAVADRERERFDQLREQLIDLKEIIGQIQERTIRKAEKVQQIIEREQEFEREAIAFLRSEYNGRFRIMDVRKKSGGLGRKTGDVILINQTYGYKIAIDWKKTNHMKPQRMSLSEVQEVAENAIVNRKTDAAVVCMQFPEQLPPEANGIYLVDHKTIITHFRFLMLSIELLEAFVKLEKKAKTERSIEIQRVEEVIERLKKGNDPLEKTIRSLGKARGALEKSISRLTNYQEQIANRAIKELEIVTRTVAPS